MDKTFPENYPSDAVSIISSMSFGKDVMLIGSASIRSQLYAGDYDAHEAVRLKYATDKEALHHLRVKFQSIIETLGGKSLKAPSKQRTFDADNLFIGDIKAGLKEEWRVIPEDFKAYSPTESLKKLKSLRDDGIITASEYTESKSAIKTDSRLDWLKALSAIKFNIVRWTPDQVKENHNTLRDGSVMTLEEAFNCPTIAKLDVIGLVGNNRFTEFSNVYEFFNNGKALNPSKEDIRRSIKDNILILESDGNYFKVLKRLFTLAKLDNDIPAIARLIPILNSDLGRLYHIIGDITTLIEILDSDKKTPMERVRFEIDQFIARLSNIYQMKDYLKIESSIIKEINHTLTLPKERLPLALEALRSKLDSILQKEAKETIKKV